jgi:N-acetylneuraminate synthase
MKFNLGNKIISNNSSVYFIADIGANHDGNLNRAKKLIKLCAQAGANGAKFQHFKAETIISKKGFYKIGKTTHQSKWKKSVFETYKEAAINFNWTRELKRECDKNKIDFLTSPYDLDYVDKVEKYICAYKIGSGDITWLEILKKISKKKLPVILATGAANLNEVKQAVATILKKNKKIILMQCNTNYTNSTDNYNFINLNVLKSYRRIFGQKIILGLSDHTRGHTAVLGAVALGARVIEKHFTDDNGRDGPDHSFSMNFNTWRNMVYETRILEKTLGDGKKKIELNEIESSIVQKRAIYAINDIKKNQIFKNNITVLRPAIAGHLSANKFAWLENKKAKKNIKKNECINLKKVIF